MHIPVLLLQTWFSQAHIWDLLLSRSDPVCTLQDQLGEKVPGRDVLKAKIAFHLQTRGLQLQGLLQHDTVNSD